MRGPASSRTPVSQAVGPDPMYTDSPAHAPPPAPRPAALALALALLALGALLLLLPRPAPRHITATALPPTSLAGAPSHVTSTAPTAAKAPTRPLLRAAPAHPRGPRASAAAAAAAGGGAAAPAAPAAAGAARGPAEVAAVGFADQMNNAAGPLFQASLLPYLAFLAFVGHGPNRLPPLALFAFRFLLVFVVATIVASIVSKTVYGVILADSDWLHGSAETLLCLTNLLLVIGLWPAPADAEPGAAAPGAVARAGALAYAAAAFAGFFALSGALDTGLLPALGPHAAFLGGAGDVPAAVVAGWGLPHAEPANALSVATWAIHVSSVLEYLVAMRLVWGLADRTGTTAWRGLTWGMLPLSASGLCACAYHFFYNAPALSFLVALQAGLTVLGNTTCAVAAYRVARANGWAPRDLLPGAPAPAPAEARPLAGAEGAGAAPALGPAVAKLAAVSVAGGYALKYGSLALDLPFEPSAGAALGLVAAPVAVTAAYYARLGGGAGGGGLSMADVKKYGAAGTVAYVLTELLFWALAFPLAALVLYRTQGHWPDLAAAGDRAALLGFVFAGANVARAALPLRLGAALALAPWVDHTLINRDTKP